MFFTQNYFKAPKGLERCFDSIRCFENVILVTIELCEHPSEFEEEILNQIAVELDRIEAEMIFTRPECSTPPSDKSDSSSSSLPSPIRE